MLKVSNWVVKFRLIALKTELRRAVGYFLGVLGGLGSTISTHQCCDLSPQSQCDARDVRLLHKHLPVSCLHSRLFCIPRSLQQSIAKFGNDTRCWGQLRWLSLKEQVNCNTGYYFCARDGALLSISLGSSWIDIFNHFFPPSSLWIWSFYLAFQHLSLTLQTQLFPVPGS